MFNPKPFIIMKKNQFTLLTITFFSGLILGITLIGIFSFTYSGSVPASSPNSGKINVQEANSLFRNYYNNAAPTNDVIRGFALNKEQLAALNYLSNENPALAGFRIYMGNDNNMGRVGIVVGVNSSGQDLTGSIYKAAAGGSGPCPTICDGNSGITGN